MKILLAYDGSPPAEAAVEEVLTRPWPPGSQVRLMMVVEPLTAAAPVEAVGVYVPVVERIRARMREEAYKQLSAALKKLEVRPELEASIELREGPARQTLLEAIREWGPGLVIAGSHGKGSLARLLLGSVSQALVAHAPCNVEIIRVPSAAA